MKEFFSLQFLLLFLSLFYIHCINTHTFCIYNILYLILSLSIYEGGFSIFLYFCFIGYDFLSHWSLYLLLRWCVNIVHFLYIYETIMSAKWGAFLIIHKKNVEKFHFIVVDTINKRVHSLHMYVSIGKSGWEIMVRTLYI